MQLLNVQGSATFVVSYLFGPDIVLCAHVSNSYSLMRKTSASPMPYRVKIIIVKVKVVPQQAEVAQGVPDRLMPRIFLTFGTTRAVGRQPYAPAAFTPGEIPGTHFQRLSRPQGTWFCRGYHGKNPQ
jgi:hypothetical protein